MSLVAVAVRLRLALLRGSLRSGPGATGRRLGLVLGAVVGGGLAVGVFALLAGSRGHGKLPEDLSVVLFTGLLASWIVVPVLTFASDDLLDPARLALLPLTRRQLVTVMGVGALVGVAPVATAVAALGVLPATGRGPGSYAVGLVSVVLLLLLCVSASRASAAALSGLLRSRRGRDLGVALTAVVALGFQLLNPLLQAEARRGGAGAGALRGLARPLRWTPPGVLASAAGRSAPGAAASLLFGTAVLGLVLALWARSVRRALERTDTTGSRRRRSTGLVPRGVPLPGGRIGAVAAKDLRYLTREPRRLVTCLTGIALPVLAIGLGPLLAGGHRPGGGIVFAVCGSAVLTGLGGANRFGQDGTSTWLLISSGTDPRDARWDLLGGDLAIAVVAVPAIVVLAVGLAAISAGWTLLPAALGTAGALLAVVVGVAALVAVGAPFPVPQTQNVFGGGQAGQGCLAGALTGLGMFAAVLLCLPVLALLVPALRSGGPGWGLALLVLGPAYGLAVGAVLRRMAAQRWAVRGPEVLETLLSAHS